MSEFKVLRELLEKVKNAEAKYENSLRDSSTSVGREKLNERVMRAEIQLKDAVDALRLLPILDAWDAAKIAIADGMYVMESSDLEETVGYDECHKALARMERVERGGS